MIVKYCHEYDEQGKKVRPFACIVGVKNDGKVGIGVSICNPTDVCKKKTGREIAETRAFNTLKFGPNPDLSDPCLSKFILCYQYCHVGGISWLTYMPKSAAIAQAMDFVEQKLCE